MRAWWIAGAAACVSAWALLVAIQAVARDPLPPEISISQYGLGPHGWLLSMWMLAVAAGPCFLYRYRPTRGWGAGWWLLVGTVGAAVMASVRTDPGGLQESVHAKIHMLGSVLALAGLPVGIVLALLAASRPWRRLALALLAVSAVALELLLVSAAGFDTTGAGAAASWSLWQSVAVAADMLLLVAQVFGSGTIPPLRGDPELRWARPVGGIRRGRRPSRAP